MAYREWGMASNGDVGDPVNSDVSPQPLPATFSHLYASHPSSSSSQRPEPAHALALNEPQPHALTDRRYLPPTQTQPMYSLAQPYMGRRTSVPEAAWGPDAADARAGVTGKGYAWRTEWGHPLQYERDRAGLAPVTHPSSLVLAPPSAGPQAPMEEYRSLALPSHMQGAQMRPPPATPPHTSAPESYRIPLPPAYPSSLPSSGAEPLYFAPQYACSPVPHLPLPPLQVGPSTTPRVIPRPPSAAGTHYPQQQQQQQPLLYPAEALTGGGDESESSFVMLDGDLGRGESVKRSSSRSTSSTRPDDSEKQARRREQNRAAQRAYKARQNKHVEEVEVRNTQLEKDIMTQKDEAQNLRDLLFRCQRENDFLKLQLQPFAISPQDLPTPESWASPANLSSLRNPTSALTPAALSPAALPPMDDDAFMAELERILSAFGVRPSLPPDERSIPSPEVRAANERVHVEHLRARYEKKYRLPMDARQEVAAAAASALTANSASAFAGQGGGVKREPGGSVAEGGIQAYSPSQRFGIGPPPSSGPSSASSVPPPSTSSWRSAPELMDEIDGESPINEDNLQEILGPRYWEYGTRLNPPPPRVPIRGLWREIKAVVPGVQKDDVDVDRLCAALQRSAFCDTVEACLPMPAFHHIVRNVIQPAQAPSGSGDAAAASSASSSLAPAT